MQHPAQPTVTPLHAARHATGHSPARRVQLDLHQVKRALDDALAETSALLSNMLSANRAAGLPAHHGQRALEEAAACLPPIIEARARAIAAHRELRAAAGKLDFVELGWGGLIPSPPEDEELRTFPASGAAGAPQPHG